MGARLRGEPTCPEPDEEDHRQGLDRDELPVGHNGDPRRAEEPAAQPEASGSPLEQVETGEDHGVANREQGREQYRPREEVVMGHPEAQLEGNPRLIRTEILATAKPYSDRIPPVPPVVAYGNSAQTMTLMTKDDASTTQGMKKTLARSIEWTRATASARLMTAPASLMGQLGHGRLWDHSRLWGAPTATGAPSRGELGVVRTRAEPLVGRS